MRWNKITPKYYSRRTVRRFLLLPKRLGEQVRWLELAWIVQRFEDTPGTNGVWVDYKYAGQPDHE